MEKEGQEGGKKGEESGRKGGGEGREGEEEERKGRGRENERMEGRGCEWKGIRSKEIERKNEMKQT